MSENQAQTHAFGRLLASAIEAAGFPTPTALARQAGLTPSVLLRAVKGENIPTVQTLRTIAPLIRIPAETLVAAAYPGSDAEPPTLPDVRERLSRDPGTFAMLDPGGRELIPELVDLIHFMSPDSNLDKEGREVARRLLNGVVMTLAQLSAQTSEVRRLSGMPEPDFDPGDAEIPDRGAPAYLSMEGDTPEAVDVVVQMYQPRESARGVRQT